MTDNIAIDDSESKLYRIMWKRFKGVSHQFQF